jgi:hypothetical protein
VEGFKHSACIEALSNQYFCSFAGAMWRCTKVATEYRKSLRGFGKWHCYLYAFYIGSMVPICMIRYCNVCSVDLDPAKLACALCSHTSGAYKPTDTKGEWVHALCAGWIPEVFCADYSKMQPFVLRNMDKKRYKLKCSLCTQKGACIQCCYGR